MRDCAFDEARVCVEKNKDNAGTIARQMERYESEGFPRHYGLSQNNIIVRSHGDARLDLLMRHWWNELVTESRRDQLGLAYAAWKTGTPLALYENSKLLAKRIIEADAVFYHFSHNGSTLGNLRTGLKFVQKIIGSALRGQTRLPDLLTILFHYARPRSRIRFPRGTDV